MYRYTYCDKTYSIHDKSQTMAGGHAVQGILSTVVVLYKHFVWNEKELTSPERRGNNHVILQQVGQCLLIR